MENIDKTLPNSEHVGELSLATLSRSDMIGAEKLAVEHNIALWDPDCMLPGYDIQAVLYADWLSSKRSDTGYDKKILMTLKRIYAEDRFVTPIADNWNYSNILQGCYGSFILANLVYEYPAVRRSAGLLQDKTLDNKIIRDLLDIADPKEQKENCKKLVNKWHWDYGRIRTKPQIISDKVAGLDKASCAQFLELCDSLSTRSKKEAPVKQDISPIVESILQNLEKQVLERVDKYSSECTTKRGAVRALLDSKRWGNYPPEVVLSIWSKYDMEDAKEIASEYNMLLWDLDCKLPGYDVPVILYINWLWWRKQICWESKQIADQLDSMDRKNKRTTPNSSSAEYIELVAKCYNSFLLANYLYKEKDEEVNQLDVPQYLIAKVEKVTNTVNSYARDEAWRKLIESYMEGHSDIKSENEAVDIIFSKLPTGIIWNLIMKCHMAAGNAAERVSLKRTRQLNEYSTLARKIIEKYPPSIVKEYENEDIILQALHLVANHMI